MNYPIHTYLKFLARQAAHKGLIRTLERFFEKENMPAKDWPPEVKEELLKSITIKLNLERIAPKDIEKARQNFEKVIKALRTPEGMKTINLFALRFKKTPDVIKLKTNLSNFTPNTQKRLKRELGLDPKYQTQHKDDKRIQKQRELAQNGINAKPIIMEKFSNGLSVIEGWHRTIAQIEKALKENRPTFELLSYVGKKTPIRNMLKELTNFLVNSLK